MSEEDQRREQAQNEGRSTRSKRQQSRYPTIQRGTGGKTGEQSLKYQLEVDEILQKIKYRLQGKVPMRKNGKLVWERPAGVEPMVNEVGVNNILLELSGRLNKIFALSDFDEKQIDWMTEITAKNIKNALDENWEEWEVRDMSAASQIVHLIDDTVYATLRKAHKGAYQKFLSTTHQVQEVQQNVREEQTRPEEQGAWDKIKNRLGM